MDFVVFQSPKLESWFFVRKAFKINKILQSQFPDLIEIQYRPEKAFNPISLWNNFWASIWCWHCWVNKTAIQPMALGKWMSRRALGTLGTQTSFWLLSCERSRSWHVPISFYDLYDVRQRMPGLLCRPGHRVVEVARWICSHFNKSIIIARVCFQSWNEFNVGHDMTTMSNGFVISNIAEVWPLKLSWSFHNNVFCL